jgi:hypothetical protein
VLGVVLSPDGLALHADGGDVAGGFGLALDWQPPAAVKVLGDPASTGVTLGGARVALTVTTAGTSVDEVAVSVAVRKLRVVLDLAALDGLVASVAGGRSIDAESDVELVWSSRTGLTLRGSGQLEKTFPLHLDLGPVRVAALTLRGIADGDGLKLTATVDLAVKLGPVAATVEGVGAALAATPAADGGLLFGLDADLDLVPPLGAGLTVKAGTVEGGGHLFFDGAKGQYAGVFQLGLTGAGGLSAWRLQGVAILNTKAADGSPLRETDGDKTFALLVSATYEWTPGIALGWGIFLNGLGLVVGYNRRTDVEEVRKATRTGALDTLLFPADPVANAPAVIDTLGRIFPPDTTGTVLGVMVRLEMLGRLLTAKLAVLIEFPEPIRVLVLGQLVLDLKQAGRLRLDIAGVIDFHRGELSLDGSLVDSKLLGRQITGDLALRVRWHGGGAFALSLGGFHPGFQPPAGFPELRRLTIALNAGGRISAYLAVTSNSVQFGGAIDLSIKFSEIVIEGHAHLDALMRFDPFWFTAELGAKVTLSVFGKTLLGVDLEIGVSGPQPWGMWGHVKLMLLFLSISKSFDTRRPGQAAPPELEPVSAVQQLRLALARPDAWETTGGGGAEPVVLRSPELPGRLVLRPGTLLGLRQNVLPLGILVERLGAARVSGPNRFDIRSFTLGNGLDGAVGEPILDRFAPGQFRDLEPAELLEQPGYQWQETGRRLGLPEGSDLPATGLTVAAALDGDDAYDAWIVDDVTAPPRPLRPAAAGMGAAEAGRLLVGFAGTGPAADAATRTGGTGLFGGAGLELTRV